MPTRAKGESKRAGRGREAASAAPPPAAEPKATDGRPAMKKITSEMIARRLLPVT